MADITISLTDEEILIAESFASTAQAGVENLVHKRIKTLARKVIDDSTSKLDPDKLSAAELRDEIIRLDGLGEIPTYAERQAAGG